MAARHHRHQISLQDFVNLSSSPPLADDVRIQADERFHQIVEHFTGSDADRTSYYNGPKLVGLMYRYAVSPKSKDNVLRAFFRAMELSMEGEAIDFSDEKHAEALRSRLVGFAEHLVNNFFMPLRASTARTPQPTPHYRSATQRSSSRDFVGTPERLSTLRGDCLTRDRHRCVISRAFDMSKARERETPEGQIPDDDGDPIEDDNISYLEVAHILPHSLVHVGSETEELSESKKTALEILNMFDNDVAHLINGVDVDRPHNAITLTLDLHRAFGNFDIYFTQIANRPHTYENRSFRRIGFQRMLPVTRVLYLTADQSIDPPAPRLLALHRAIGHILHLSGSGEYIDDIFRKLADRMVQFDGSTPLAELVQLRMNGWNATPVYS
ncbi:hypothetical protein TOPH_08098 [Tolypocladium ophioglossoides CBS 100239]|uniref:HNH nuclease domain-containing protein n=1 Tax=Tolypocladium ophioglossoides (strain CBS 100239) TaxID=1163406 RepID=A0A0L0MZR6_TOLOC|nr:hypothetical protein TOPH_08098 [Tolypocladium ophioglossoides CBS 100239]